MTLGTLAESIDWKRCNPEIEPISGSSSVVACACVGYPNCCYFVGLHLDALQIGAHIMAKLVQDLHDKRDS